MLLFGYLMAGWAIGYLCLVGWVYLHPLTEWEWNREKAYKPTYLNAKSIQPDYTAYTLLGDARARMEKYNRKELS